MPIVSTPTRLCGGHRANLRQLLIIHLSRERFLSLARLYAPQSRLAAPQTARQGIPESDIEDVIVPSTPPLAGESQGGITIALAIRTPERLRETPKADPCPGI